METPSLPTETADVRDGSMFAAIHVTPLTDVLLVMIGIVLVSALAVGVGGNVGKRTSPPAGIVVKPPPGPEREVAQPRPSSRPMCAGRSRFPEHYCSDRSLAALVLELPISGGVYIGGKRLTGDELDKAFRAAARNPQTLVIMRIERGVEHARVTHARVTHASSMHARVTRVVERGKALGLRRFWIEIRGEDPCPIDTTTVRSPANHPMPRSRVASHGCGRC